MGTKITEVKSATVVGNYYWTFARVYAGDLYGTGEGFFAPRLESVIRDLGELLIGEDALEMGRIYDKLFWASLPSGPEGTNFHAISALEIALLDLVGKHLNVPVYTLLGGKRRDKVRMYVDTHAGKVLDALDPKLLPITPKWAIESGETSTKGDSSPIHGRAAQVSTDAVYSPGEYAKRAKQMKNDGFTAIKLDLDVPTPFTKDYNRESGSLNNPEVRYLTELATAVRESVGEEVDILFDLHWRYNVESSIRLARSIESLNVMWLEDPVPPSNPELLTSVANSTRTPIATGENIYGRHGFARLLQTPIKVVTPDALKAGGLSEVKFISQMAGMNEIVTSPHNIGSPLGTVAQAHLAAAIPNFGVLEFHGHDVPIWDSLVGDEVIRDGFIQMTDAPGLGVELETKTAKKYSLNDQFDL